MLDSMRKRPLAVMANLGVRAALAYFSVDALRVTTADPSDPRYAGKGIAMRNALILGSFSALLPALYLASRRDGKYPWGADAMLISVPIVDMLGNWLDLYNEYGWYDTVAHIYGPGVLSALLSLALEGRGREPRLVRWLMAVGTTTFVHLLLEMQEYWTDVLFGTHNVEGLEDVEYDLGSGVIGALCGLGVAEIGLAREGKQGRLATEARRLAAALAPLWR